MQFDFTHWNILVSWVIIIAELVVGTVPDPPWMRILAMPVPSIFLVFALEMLVFEFMYVFVGAHPVPHFLRSERGTECVLLCMHFWKTSSRWMVKEEQDLGTAWISDTNAVRHFAVCCTD
jgi:hypothetical protein